MDANLWGCSSVGRAPALQAGGQEFESLHLHWQRTWRIRAQAKYEPSRSRVDVVSENERKRSLNLQIDLPENLTKISLAQMYLENCIPNEKLYKYFIIRHPRY